MSIILDGFTNEYGQHFDNIRDVHFCQVGDILAECGMPLYKSAGSMSPGQIVIFRSIEPNKALRIDKNYSKYLHLFRDDEVLVSQLQARQKDVMLTEFPTGVVTIEDRVIGQEIPFYDQTLTLDVAAKEGKIGVWSDSLGKSLEVLRILQELLKAGVIYQDVHLRNFVYNLKTGKLNLIDFDDRYIKFDENQIAYNRMISNVKMTINDLNSYFGYCFDDEFFGLCSIDEIDEYVRDARCRALKR